MGPTATLDVQTEYTSESQEHLAYVAFARQAADDGFRNVARLFHAIAYSESRHAHFYLQEADGEGGGARPTAEMNYRPLYEKALEQFHAGRDVEETPIFVCGRCGHAGEGEAPDWCPVCENPRPQFHVF
jgi:rubrerythrin